METEERNQKPKPSYSNAPAIALGILFGLVVLLLYAGWNLMSDDSSNITDMKSIESAQKNKILESSDSYDSDIIQSEMPSAPIIEEEKIVQIVEEPEEKKPETKPKEEVKKESNYNGTLATHTVKEGETFFGIANKFNTNTDNLQNLNPDVNPNTIKVGITKLKVPVQAVHTVGPGDILRVVAEKYGISVDALMAANGKKKNHSERGEKLLIPHKKKV